MTIVIDGKAIAAEHRQALTGQIADFKTKTGVTPGLAVILVGDDPASHIYVGNKVKACEKVGIASSEHRLPAHTSKDDLITLIQKLNNDKDIHGILLQLPLPDHLNASDMILEIDPAKDVDGLHSLNAGRLMAGLDTLSPCTPQGSLYLIQTIEKNLSGLHAVIIGRSLLFGKPMGQILLNADCTVTQCHSRTQNLPDLCRQADILIAAVGQANMVKGDWVKKGAIIIDVGINRLDDGSLCGDVDFDQAKQNAKAITPVPGGVGPMTITCLLMNTLKAAQKLSS